MTVGKGVGLNEIEGLNEGLELGSGVSEPEGDDEGYPQSPPDGGTRES